MNPIAEEMRAIIDADEDTLKHYGMPRRSGRYPWGSGEDPYQHASRDFIGRVEELRKTNPTFKDPKTGTVYTGETAIAKTLGLSTTQYRTEYRLASHQRKMNQINTAKRLRDKEGLNTTEIGRRMGVNESTVRGWFKDGQDNKIASVQKTADFVKKRIKEDGILDVGKDVNRELGISPEKFKESLYLLEREGYPILSARIEQPTNPGHWTTIKTIGPKGTTYPDIYKAFEEGKVHSLNKYYSHDGGETFDKFEYPKSLSSKRVKILLADEVGPDGQTGIQKDGLIQIRRGVKDLTLGEGRQYAQVRILVDDDKYLKGMAVYSDNLPDGVDVLMNSNKTTIEKAYKNIKNDPDNPFGALISPKGQSHYKDENGEWQLSPVNRTRHEGEWSEWADALPSQFLSKQSLSLAKKQLDLARIDKMAEYDDICELNNPTIKKHMLYKFAEECDAAAVNLKAAALPGQKYHVIVPINTLKDTEVYAPGYENGTKLALVRYPHGGTFEIPILTVNNKNPDAIKYIGKQSMDGIGITKAVADRLSGADFDGDTVMCIPTHNGRTKIISTDRLKGLENFESTQYQYDTKTPDGRYFRNGKEFKPISEKYKNIQMGIISNLITDMTLAGAPTEELAAAVRHSMVIIDAEKHKLDYKQSEIDNNVKALHKKWQGYYDENGRYHSKGAGTIISRAKGEYDVIKRQGTPKINIKGSPDYDPTKPEGSLIYKIADDAEMKITKINKRTGEAVTKTEYKMQKSTRMAEADDAYNLVSDAKYPMEILYADHANALKALANQARVEYTKTGNLKYSPSAKETYIEEYNSLVRKIHDAELNSPREREAIRRATADVAAKQAADPKLTVKDIKKLKQQAMTKYRNEVGAISRAKRNIEITDREWEAIQAGAISDSKLRQILNNTDADVLKQRAMPRTTSSLSQAQVNRIKNMASSDMTISEIAAIMGKSPSTISKYLKGGN